VRSDETGTTGDRDHVINHGNSEIRDSTT
jgi:hypothetical protein